ncbi:MAG: hypothetical protein GC136_10735 [Alphaproteobacteria bacterium]|nr:hypothetical protein [Alphaproteobacteria bacterium]
MKKTLLLTSIGLTVLTLSACENARQTYELKHNAQYWERADTTDAIYQRGPKANQLLQRDIARCTTEINELYRVGIVKHAVPMPGQMNSEKMLAKAQLDSWDSPNRDGYMLAQTGDYNDFEGCMAAKGWERVEHLPYEQAKRAREDYIEAIHGEKARSTFKPVPNPTASGKANTQKENSPLNE